MDAQDSQELQEPKSADIDTQEQDEETETKGDRASRKNSRGLLKDRLKIIDKLIKDPKNKSGKQSDLCIQASEIERLLWQADREDKADKTRAELATANAEISRLSDENARLTQANAELRASRTSQRVVERIPDAVLQEQVQTLEELLKSVATLARSVDVEERTRHAVKLVVNYGVKARTAVEGLGVDFSSVSMALKEKDTELLSRLEQAKQEGPITPVLRAVLYQRDSITATIGKQQPRFRNEFSDEYERL